MSKELEKKRETVPEVREYHTSSCGGFFEVRKVLCRELSPYQKIEVLENPHFGRILFLDGLVQTTERDEFFYHEILVHPALVSHAEAKKVLVIGGGDGGILKEILRHPVEEVVLVEIDAKVIEICRKYFPWHSQTPKDKRIKFIIEDGKCYVERSKTKFDVILVDSSDPIGPSSVLHKKKFFEVLKTRLRPRGVIVSQTGSPFFHSDQIKEKSGFLSKIFKTVRFFIAPVPSYPGGLWSYVFLSDEIDPLDVEIKAPAGLKYYNPAIHHAVFSLPNFLNRVTKPK